MPDVSHNKLLFLSAAISSDTLDLLLTEVEHTRQQITFPHERKNPPIAACTQSVIRAGKFALNFIGDFIRKTLSVSWIHSAGIASPGLDA